MDDEQASNPYGIEMFPVRSATGSEVTLMTKEESEWYQKRRDEYQRDNKFVNVSDLLDLDRLLMMEVLVYRYSVWLGQGYDYMQSLVPERELKDNLNSFSSEIRQLKKALGIDKVSRDASKGSSLPDYLTTLLDRAREFGYHRNRQYEMAVTTIFALQSKVLTYYRADERERRELDLSPELIVEWIRDEVIPKFGEIDESFRKQQAIWIKDL
jgi:hypothetical protein